MERKLAALVIAEQYNMSIIFPTSRRYHDSIKRVNVLHVASFLYSHLQALTIIFIGT